MCTYCETHGMDLTVHVACQFCSVETAWMNTSYLYDVDKDGKIIRRYLACNGCRNILDPK